MSFKNIKYEVVDGVAVIAFADPATLNALTAATVTELREAFTRAEKEARSAILTGEGRGFSSGANLSGGGGGPTLAEDGKPDAGATLETHFNPLVTQMQVTLEKDLQEAGMGNPAENRWCRRYLLTKYHGMLTELHLTDLKKAVERASDAGKVWP